MKPNRIGSVAYLLWGLLHVLGGAAMLAAATASPEGGFAMLAETSEVFPELAGAVLQFHAFNLLWIGLLVSAVALRGNWYNRSNAAWLNLWLAGCADLGLLLFMVVPGHLAVSDAAPGFVLLLVAAPFSLWALRTER